MSETTTRTRRVFSIDPAVGSTIADFCRRWGMSKATFHRNIKAGIGPRTTHFGTKAVILTDDEAKWVERARNGEFKKPNTCQRVRASS